MERRKSKILFILLMVSILVQAQDKFRWQSRLSAADGEGFYRVLISPHITALSEADHRDLRVVDSVGHYVPYLIKSEVPIEHKRGFMPAHYTTKTDSVYTLQIDNPDGEQYTELWITMRNKSLATSVFLSGSDDGLHWFEISGDIVLYPSRETASDTFEQRVSFLPVRYRQLRFTTPMTGNIPVNVIRVGIYESMVTGGRYTELPAPKINQKDSDKISYVTLKYDGNYRIDWLRLSADGPRLFHRHMKIYSYDSTSKIQLGEYMLSSASENVIDLSVKTTTLLLEIDNQDNPPVEIKQVEAKQLNRYALMYLNGDRSYFLLFGNEKAEKPSYDLEFFEDSLRAHQARDLKTGSISANSIIPSTEPARKEAKGIKAYWIWPVLIAVLCGLLFFTMRIGKEISGNDN